MVIMHQKVQINCWRSCCNVFDVVIIKVIICMYLSLNTCVSVRGGEWPSLVNECHQQKVTFHQLSSSNRLDQVSVHVLLTQQSLQSLSLLAGLVSRSPPLLAWLQNISALCITILAAHQTTSKGNSCLFLSSFWVFILSLFLSISPHVLVLMSVMNRGRTWVFWGWIWRLVLIRGLWLSMSSTWVSVEWVWTALRHQQKERRGWWEGGGCAVEQWESHVYLADVAPAFSRGLGHVFKLCLLLGSKQCEKRNKTGKVMPSIVLMCISSSLSRYIYWGLAGL